MDYNQLFNHVCYFHLFLFVSLNFERKKSNYKKVYKSLHCITSLPQNFTF